MMSGNDSSLDNGSFVVLGQAGPAAAQQLGASEQLWEQGQVEGVSLAGLVFPTGFSQSLSVKKPERRAVLFRTAPLNVAAKLSSLLG
jgi:hypothetical protein